MGNHSSWYNKEKRKVLILTFELDYIRSKKSFKTKFN